MTAIASVIILAAIFVPAISELHRIHWDRTNPLQKLRIPTRRNQVPAPSASGSFADL